MSDLSKKKKLSTVGLSLMIFTAIYGFANIMRANFKMSYGAIPWYIIGALFFFLPFAFMVTELGSCFRKEKGGIYSWMEKSVGPTFSFIGTFMWYASWVIWMVNISVAIMVPITNVIFGDSNHLPAPWVLSLFGIVWMFVITNIASHGMGFIKKVAAVGGIAVISLNIVLLIAALIIVIKNGHPAQPLDWHALASSPAPGFDNSSIIGFIAFMVFAVFAYGGVEAIGGLVDETENPKRNFPRGVIISALIIAAGYSLMILLVGFYLNYQPGGYFWEGVKSGTINLGNAAYVSMQILGESLGNALGLSSSTGVILGGIFARYMGLAMLLALMGAFFTLIYSPVKQIISGTPDKLWPGHYGELNKKDGMPKNAMKVQLIIVVVIILINMVINLGGGPVAAKKFFEILTNMTNVSMTIPFLFIIIAFGKFKLNDNIEKSFTIFKSKPVAMIAVIVAFIVVSFSDIFTIIQPITDYFALPAAKQKTALVDTVETVVTMIAGPVIFATAAAIIMRKYKKKYPEEYSSLTEFHASPEDE